MARIPASVSAMLRPYSSSVKWRQRRKSRVIAIHLIGQWLLSAFTARDHQRNARFIDQDGIGFVDHCGGERPVDLVVRIERQSVAQQIEPDLVGGGVGDVASISARRSSSDMPC